MPARSGGLGLSIRSYIQYRPGTDDTDVVGYIGIELDCVVLEMQNLEQDRGCDGVCTAPTGVTAKSSRSLRGAVVAR